jgi:hypothetical protein
MLDGLEQLPDEQRPPKDVLLQWSGFVQVIEQNAIAMANASADAVEYIRGKGFACTLLKGSAVGRYYPNPNRRQSGDIDVWLDGGRMRIYDFARKFDKDGKLYGVNYQHIHFHLFDDIPLEVHIWPSCLSNPLHNKRFHQFCAIHHPVMGQSMPSLAFDRVFILMHCYNHMTGNGVGLRQIMDYYFVLKNLSNKNSSITRYAIETVQEFGLERFAKGLMWVMHEALGLPKEWMLWEPDEKEGRYILSQVMQCGNFGHHDQRLTHGGGKWNTIKQVCRHNWHLMSHYPADVIWAPVWFVWHKCWKLKTKMLLATN